MTLRLVPALLALGQEPVPRYSSVVELSDWSYAAFVEKCAAPQRACVLRGWADEKTQASLGWAALTATCGGFMYLSAKRTAACGALIYLGSTTAANEQWH